jgi:hypothetical protein
MGFPRTLFSGILKMSEVPESEACTQMQKSVNQDESKPMLPVKQNLQNL